MDLDENVGVYDLITELCSKTAQECRANIKIPQRRLVSQMRSHSYELILKKTAPDPSVSKNNPLIDLLSYSYILEKNVKNVSEYKRSLELKSTISSLREMQEKLTPNENQSMDCVLSFLIPLTDSVKNDDSATMFQCPFTFGLLDQMVPRPPPEVFGSPEPYAYYPAHVFELPYSVEQLITNDKSLNYKEYAVECLDSKMFPVLSRNYGNAKEPNKPKFSPMLIASLVCSQLTPLVEDCLTFPKLTTPRELVIPRSQPTESHVKVSLASKSINPEKSEVQEVFKTQTEEYIDIWEIASQIDKDVPENIWEIVSKMPDFTGRQLISSCSREMGLWRQNHDLVLADLNIVTENHFIRHLMYLTIGVETSSFSYNKEWKCFCMKEDLCLEGISKDCIQGYVSSLLIIGTYYKRLFDFAFNQTLEDHFHSNGLIYEAARETVRRYLLKFRLNATEMYEDCFTGNTEENNCLPTLLSILHRLEPIKYEIETIATIFKLTNFDSANTLPKGAELMSYLFNEISLVTHRQTSFTMFNALFAICKVYFKFIERFIFEGELNDRNHEFFIRKDSQHVNSCSKRYWDKGFYISQSFAVPEFLRVLAKCILLCGKSLRLLKLCNPNDPLVVLISSDHPSIKCCSSFEELEQQQEMLNVYRTRCLFVCGEPATFQQILLRKEAEKKAFTEMASIKQAETMEKIVAERQRLSQLIIAEKQHSLRVLEAAMAESKAAKLKSKQRERVRTDLGKSVEKSREEVDSKLRDEEKNKIMEYYSKLNMEVEKSKMHAEWKIKRLQLDQTRIQLLSTEERNLKREKLELKHQQIEENMAMSIQSIGEGESFDEIKNSDTEIDKPKVIDKTLVVKESNDVFNVIYKAAKNLFTRNTNNDNCDNQQELDNQGNVIKANTEINDNTEYVNTRADALGNKDKVLSHGSAYTEFDNSSKITNVDQENNLDISDPFKEAKRNKFKILRTEYENYIEPTKVITRTEAQKQALINRHKVLGVEYNLDTNFVAKEPVNDAQREAVRNKKKILGVDNNPESKFVTKEPVNDAQRDAVRNKNKILGVDNNSEIKFVVKEPANDAQRDAVRNKNKILGVDNTSEIKFVVKEPANDAQRDAVRNKNKILGVDNTSEIKFVVKEPANDAQRDAVRNKNKILGVDNTSEIKFVVKEPVNDAQREAVRNKNNILGVEYNLEANFVAKEPANDAQRAAVKNKNKILGTEIGSVPLNSKKQSVKRSELTLNLKPYDDPKEGISPTSGVTPADFLQGLDLETPTTAEVPIESQFLGLTPLTEENDEKRRFDENGFNFSNILVDEENLNLSDTQNSSSEILNTTIDDELHKPNFDPFGVNAIKEFSNKSTNEFHYTNPADIMREVGKKPYANIFKVKNTDDDKDCVITCDNIPTLTACLQRSVMLPLTYQLEVVNKSILTYFLVNLDMYEHLRSLRDYFFLMDGEFSRSICHNLFDKLTKIINPQDLLNFSTLHNILDKALGCSISHIHKFSENLSFTISEVPLSFQHSSPDVLQCLSLTYSVTWPLNIILSPEALVRYAKVFQFLVKMRRISWILGQDFETLKLSVKLSGTDSKILLRSPQYRSIQIYRHIMASLIRGLDNYIVTTCIHTPWNEFEGGLKKATTLDDLYDCHVSYIKQVFFRCLLNNRSTPVMKLLNDIFTIILKFSRVLKAGIWEQKEETDPFEHQNFNQLQDLFRFFEKLAKYLHKVITRLMECGYQRHLVELLTLVNLNGYYSPELSKDTNNSSLRSNC